MNTPEKITLTYFIPMVSFCTPRKHRKALVFFVFSGSMEIREIREIHGMKYVKPLIHFFILGCRSQ